MDEYAKLKCVYCNYEFASKSIKPRCGVCGSRRLNKISEFSISKPFKKNPVLIPEREEKKSNIAEVQTMVNDKKKDATEEYNKTKVEETEEEDDDDLDLF